MKLTDLRWYTPRSGGQAPNRATSNVIIHPDGWRFKVEFGDWNRSTFHIIKGEPGRNGLRYDKRYATVDEDELVLILAGCRPFTAIINPPTDTQEVTP